MIIAYLMWFYMFFSSGFKILFKLGVNKYTFKKKKKYINFLKIVPMRPMCTILNILHSLFAFLEFNCVNSLQNLERLLRYRIQHVQRCQHFVNFVCIWTAGTILYSVSSMLYSQNVARREPLSRCMNSASWTVSKFLTILWILRHLVVQDYLSQYSVWLFELLECKYAFCNMILYTSCLLL